MLSARWYKVLHDLLGSKTRTVLIVLSMAVGIFALGIILSSRSILSEGLSTSFAAIHPSSGIVHTVELFDEDFLHSMRSMPDVQEADARRNIGARVQAAGGDWENLTLFVMADYGNMRVDKISPQSGAWPPPEREILIERAALAVIGVQPGETVLLKMPNDAEREMRVAGVVHDPAQLPAQLDSTPYGYISSDTLEWLGEPYGFNELHVISTRGDDKQWSQQVLNRVKDKAERSGYTIPLTMTADPGQLPMDDMVEGILLLMGILGMLSLGLSVFLVINTVTALLAQQRRQIGVMKAVGGGTLQILGMYLVMVMSYGVLALLIAIPLGMRGARLLSSALAVFFNFDIPSSTEAPPGAVLLQVAIGLVLPVLASIYPFLSGLRISPAEAMSSYTMGRGRFGHSRLDHLLSGANLWFARRLPVRSAVLSARNTFRNKGRLALTLLTLTLGSATFISVFNVRSSLTTTVDDMMKWFAADVLVSFDRPYRAARVETPALRTPGVERTDVWLQMPAHRVRPDDSEGETLYLFVPRVGPDSLMQAPGLTGGRWLEPSDAAAVVVPSQLFLDEPDLHVGSDMLLKLYGEEHTFRIVGSYVGTPFISVLYANYDYVAHITDRVGEADALMARFSTSDPASVSSISSAIEREFDRVGIGVNMMSTIVEERRDAEASFDVLAALLFIMALLLALVGGLGLMGTMSINVLERTREIGVLRAIGAPNRGVAQVFILEGVAIGLMSWGMGAVLALPMTRGLNAALGNVVLGVPLSYSYSLPGLGLWLLLVMLLSALASFIPARNASRLTVREVLAYE